MRVLFVYSDLFPTYPDWPGHYYVGIGILSAILKQEGHETSLIHVTQKFADGQEFLERVKAFDPDLIGFSSTTLTFKYVREMAGWLHNANLGIPVISGGVHSTLATLEVIETPGIDMACVGEGEISLRNLIDALDKGKDFRKLPGIWVNDNGTIHQNGVSPAVRDLDELPFPDRAIFNYPTLISERIGQATIMASRGCPYNCAYCSNQVLKQTSFADRPADYVRFPSVDYLIAEIKQVLNDYPFVESLNFSDDLFFLRKKWAAEFTEKYTAQVGLPFGCNMRPNHINPEIASLLKEAGCTQVRVGLESGNEYIRNEMLKRNLTDQQMYEAFQCCRDAEITIHTYNIIGIPNETSATVLDTIKMNAKAKTDSQDAFAFCPFPKTELYDLCKKKGFIVDYSGGDLYAPMLNINTIPRKRIVLYQQFFRPLVRFYRMAYKLPSPISKGAEKVLDRLLQTYCFHIICWFLSPLRKLKLLIAKYRVRLGFGAKKWFGA